MFAKGGYNTFELDGTGNARYWAIGQTVTGGDSATNAESTGLYLSQFSLQLTNISSEYPGTNLNLHQFL